MARKVSDYLVIDCHTHFFPPELFQRIAQNMPGDRPVSGYSGSLEDFLRFMERDHIHRAVILNFLTSASMTDAALRDLTADLPDYEQAAHDIERSIADRVKRNNARAMDLVKGHPGLLPFISVDPLMSATEMRQEIVDRVHGGARGLKLNPGMCRYFPFDRRLWPAYATAQELDLPVMAQSYIMPGPTQYSEPKFYGDALAAFPKLRLVLTHSGLPWWDQVRVLARKYPNVCLDISVVLDPAIKGSMTTGEFVTLYREIGMNRIVYGSSFPWHERGPVLDRILELPITEAERRQVLGENAVRILKVL